jgi:hypothetical protein
VAARITDYLTGGGLFNPEMANHDAVRDLLIDARAELAAARAESEQREKEAYKRGWNRGFKARTNRNRGEVL